MGAKKGNMVALDLPALYVCRMSLRKIGEMFFNRPNNVEEMDSPSLNHVSKAFLHNFVSDLD